MGRCSTATRTFPTCTTATATEPTRVRGGTSAQAHVNRLDRIGRVDHLPDLRQVVEERNQPGPVAVADGQIVFVPFGLELSEPLLGFLGRDRLVDALQVGRYLRPALPENVVQAVVPATLAISSF